MHHHTTTIDTAIEPEDVVLPNGEVVTELTSGELEVFLNKKLAEVEVLKAAQDKIREEAEKVHKAGVESIFEKVKIDARTIDKVAGKIRAEQEDPGLKPLGKTS